MMSSTTKIQESAGTLSELLWAIDRSLDPDDEEQRELIMDCIDTIETMRGMLNSPFILSLIDSIHLDAVMQWIQAGIYLLHEVYELLFDWQTNGLVGVSLAKESASCNFFQERFKRLESHVEAFSVLSKSHTLNPQASMDISSLTDITRLFTLHGEAMEFWCNKFGSNVYQVSFAYFKHQLSTVFPALSDRAWIQLQATLDCTQTGKVTVQSWGAFLDGFGPTVASALEQMEDTLGNEYFAGFITFEETNSVLSLCPSGAFLVRFSTNHPCALVICHKDDLGAVVQRLVVSKRGQYVFQGRPFANLAEVIASESNEYRFPAGSVRTVARQSYFMGFLTQEQTKDMLIGEADGTFLFRFSATQQGALVVAFKLQGKVEQSRIFAEPDKGGYRLGKKIYRSIDAIVSQNAEKLKRPYNTPNPTQVPVAAAVAEVRPSYLNNYDRYGGIFKTNNNGYGVVDQLM
jgi:hypothetical protein